MTEQEKEKIELWIENRLRKREKFYQWLRGLLIRIRLFILKPFGTNYSKRLIILRAIFILLLASSPVWINYLLGEKVETKAAFISIPVLTVVIFFAWLIDIKIQSGKEETVKDQVAVQFSRAHSDVITKIKNLLKIDDTQLKERLREGILECIKYTMMMALNNFDKDSFHVTLLVFNNTQGTKLKVDSHSSKPSFGIIRDSIIVNSSETISYYIAKHLQPKVLHNIDIFHPHTKSPLCVSDRGYKSMIIIPILDHSGTNMKYNIPGILIIYGKLPYLFYQKYAKITELIVPFSSMLKAVLKNPKHKISIEGSV